MTQSKPTETISSTESWEPYFIFLDDLREIGAVNMLGAGSFLRENFEISREQSQKILSGWMKTFDGEASAATRAAIAKATGQ